MFYKTIGRFCNNNECSEKGKLKDAALSVCEACGTEMAPERILDSRQVGIAVALVVALLGGGAFYAYQQAKSAAIRAGTGLVRVAGEAARSAAIDRIRNAGKAARSAGMTDRSESLSATNEQRLKDQIEGDVKRTTDTLFVKMTFKNGIGYSAQKQYDNALKEFALVEKTDPAFPGLQMNMGVAYLQRKDYENARVHLKKALEQSPIDRDAEYNMACLLAAIGKRQEALQSLASAVSHGFNDRSALKTDPDLKPLRAEPEFQALLTRISSK